MKKRITALLFVICLCLICLCSCGKEKEVKHKKIHVGVLCYDQSDTFLSELINCFREQFKKDGIDVVITVFDAAGSQRTQDDQLLALVAEDCDVWCVNLVDRTDTSEIIDTGRDGNVPIIFFNREPVEEDMMRWDKLYYVGADAKQSGILQGELAAEAIKANPGIDRNRDGKIQYVIIEGEPGHQDSFIRTENAVNELKNRGVELEKLGCGIANWNRAQAQNRMMKLIEQNKNTIELVLANNDEMAIGAKEAYEKLNYTETDIPIIFGVDGTEEGLEAVKLGRIAGTVYNDKEGQAKAMEQLTMALITGKGMDELDFTKDKYIYLQYYKINNDNIEQYLDKTGVLK